MFHILVFVFILIFFILFYWDFLIFIMFSYFLLFVLFFGGCFLSFLLDRFGVWGWTSWRPSSQESIRTTQAFLNGIHRLLPRCISIPRWIRSSLGKRVTKEPQTLGHCCLNFLGTWSSWRQQNQTFVLTWIDIINDLRQSVRWGFGLNIHRQTHTKTLGHNHN